MTPLPERKKSHEELAALRDQLGITQANKPEPAVAPAEASPSPIPLAPPTGKTVRPVPHEPIPVEVAPVPLDPMTKLPIARHSDGDLVALRRLSVLDTQEHARDIPIRRAHSALVIAGYVVALSAAVPIYYNLPIILPVAICLASLAWGAFLFLKRPYSSHHGAFIAILVLFVLTYAALHYFPHLRHAT